jgi:hypothetical protein
LKSSSISLILAFLVLLSIILGSSLPQSSAILSDAKLVGAVASEWFETEQGRGIDVYVESLIFSNDPRIGPHSVGWIVPILTYEKVVYCLVPPRIDDVRPGDRVEAYGLVVEGPALAIQCEGYLIKLGPSGPPEIVVVGVWVTPRNPHQEDMVSFGAEIANIGGADAYGFRVEVHLDGYLWDSGTASVSAGSSITLTSDRQYQAEDGSHEVRWIVNSDRSIEESNYGNNEGSANFFVSPRTVTLTEHATITRTKTQTDRHTLTITTTRTLTRTHTTDTTVRNTVTANPVTVTQTLTGLITSMVYSPTVTTTVTVAAQMISNPLVWLAVSTFAMIGALFQLPDSVRLRRFYRRFAALLPLPRALAWLMKREVRKALFAVCLISVIVLSISYQADQQAFASTVTTTRTITVTEWTTLTESITSTRYVTSAMTDTSTLTRTKKGFTTVTPTVTSKIDRRSTTIIYVPTTTTITSKQAKGPSVDVSLDYNTQSTFFYIPNVDQSIPLPAKSLGFILNEVRVEVTATNVGNEVAKKVQVLLDIDSPRSEPTGGNDMWEGDLEPNQKATFYYSFKVRHCLPVKISVVGGYQDSGGQSRLIEKREVSVPVGDFIIIETKGGWSEVTLSPKLVEVSKTIGGAGITLVRILFWSLVAEKVVDSIDAWNLEESIKTLLIDKPIDKAWEALQAAIGGIDISFEVGLGWETYNLYSCARKGHAPSGNGVVFADGTMEYWPLWWSAPGIAASLIRSVLKIE